LYKFNTGQYTAIECFAKPTGPSGHLKLTDPQGRESFRFTDHPYYNWIKIPLHKNTDYYAELDNIQVSVAYLSGGEDLLERGICYIEFAECTRVLEGKELSKHYDSPIREQYHFSPIKNWVNDPNGLCWFKGYYHLFFQANPHEQKWDIMYWGHAVSRDLIHWTHMPYVLEPQRELFYKDGSPRTGGAFSGCAVPLKDQVNFYLTRHEGELGNKFTREYQTMAVSRDMVRLENETVVLSDKPRGVLQDFRDPKVTKIDGSWYMVLGCCKDGKPSVLLYRSEDLLHWDYVNDLVTEREADAATLECPDFFQLDGKYIAMAGLMGYTDLHGRFQMTKYYVGQFENEKFKAEQTGWLDFGGNFYAAQSFAHDGKRFLIGWISDFYNEHIYRENGAYGSFGLPRILKVKENKLFMEPVPQVYGLIDKVLYRGCAEKVSVKAIEGNTYYAKITFRADTDFKITLVKDEERYIGLEKRGRSTEIVTYGAERSNIHFVADVTEVKFLEIFVDRRLTEVFINHGEAVGSKIFYTEKHDGEFEFAAEQEDALEEIEVAHMGSIW